MIDRAKRKNASFWNWDMSVFDKRTVFLQEWRDDEWPLLYKGEKAESGWSWWYFIPNYVHICTHQCDIFLKTKPPVSENKYISALESQHEKLSSHQSKSKYSVLFCCTYNLIPNPIYSNTQNPLSSRPDRKPHKNQTTSQIFTNTLPSLQRETDVANSATCPQNSKSIKQVVCTSTSTPPLYHKNKKKIPESQIPHPQPSLTQASEVHTVQSQVPPQRTDPVGKISERFSLIVCSSLRSGGVQHRVQDVPEKPEGNNPINRLPTLDRYISERTLFLSRLKTAEEIRRRSLHIYIYRWYTRCF